MKGTACALLAGMCAFMLSASAPRAQDVNVELRGTAGAAQGVLVRMGPDGVAVRVDRGGIQREELFPWSEVRECEAGAAKNDAAQWLAAGEALWRGRSRAMRGDWELALQPLTAAAQAWRGQSPTPDGLAAALGATAACVRAGQTAQALPFAFESMRLLRAGVAPPDWARDGLAAVDAPRGIPVAVPPMAITGDAAAEAAKSLRAFAAPDDAAIEQSAQLYAALLDGAPAAALKASKQSEETRQGLNFLGLLRDTRADTPAARAAARRNLAALRRTLPAWSDAWVRFALGVSLAMETDAPARERAAILLLSVDAVDRAGNPALAAAARERASTILTGLGDTVGAERVREVSANLEEAAPDSGR